MREDNNAHAAVRDETTVGAGAGAAVLARRPSTVAGGEQQRSARSTSAAPAISSSSSSAMGAGVGAGAGAPPGLLLDAWGSFGAEDASFGVWETVDDDDDEDDGEEGGGGGEGEALSTKGGLGEGRRGGGSAHSVPAPAAIPEFRLRTGRRGGKRIGGEDESGGCGAGLNASQPVAARRVDPSTDRE